MNESWMNNYAEFLDKRSKNNLHIQLFADPKIKSIKIPILNPDNPLDHFRPFRNLRCKLGKCLYDFNTLITLQKMYKKEKKFGFICKYCSEMISFDAFFEDLTLKKIIAELKFDQNKNKEISFTKIRLFRNGSLEPIISEYNRLMREKMYGNPLGSRVHGTTNKNEGKLKYEFNYGNFVDPEKYDKDEYKDLNENIKLMNNDENLVVRYNIMFTVNDYKILREEKGFTINMMTFFLLYLQDYLNIFKQRNKHQCYITGFKVKNFNAMNRKIDYEKFINLKENIQKGAGEIAKHFESVLIVIFYEGKYSLGIINTNNNILYLIDFLDNDLKTFEDKELIEIFSILSSLEIHFKFLSSKKLKTFKHSIYSDFGLYILLFIYKTIMEDEQRIDKIQIREDEKMNFKRHLLWIVLKMSGQKSEKFYFYDFETESPVKKLRFDIPQYTTEGEENESNIIRSKSISKSKTLKQFEPDLNYKINLNDWLFDDNGLNSKKKETMKTMKTRNSSSKNSSYEPNFLNLPNLPGINKINFNPKIEETTFFDTNSSGLNKNPSPKKILTKRENVLGFQVKKSQP